jgi:hypothetical protein
MQFFFVSTRLRRWFHSRFARSLAPGISTRAGLHDVASLVRHRSEDNGERTSRGRLPGLGIFAGRKDGVGASIRNGIVAIARVVGPVCGHAADLLLRWDLAEQIGQHRRVADVVSGDLDRPDLQLQQALHETRGLAQRHAEQHLHGETGLNGGIATGLPAAALAGRRSVLLHLGVEPDRQRASACECLVRGWPVRRLVGRRGGFAHACQLPRWIHKMNPSRALCNKAVFHQRSITAGLYRAQIFLAAHSELSQLLSDHGYVDVACQGRQCPRVSGDRGGRKVCMVQIAGLPSVLEWLLHP